jgi:DNA-binding protein HU-beta
MTKIELVEEISKAQNLSKQEVLTIIESLMKTVKASLIKGENIYLRGFGTFHVVKRAQKTARVISKNEEMIIPAHNIPRFKPSKEFAEKVKRNVKVNK